MSGVKMLEKQSDVTCLILDVCVRRRVIEQETLRAFVLIVQVSNRKRSVAILFQAICEPINVQRPAQGKQETRACTRLHTLFVALM
jgi:hypothetical protein